MNYLYFPVGTSNFEKIRSQGYYYVDKTGMIKEILTERTPMVMLITRPRRFGKTLGMSMLEAFFDIRKDHRALFEGLEIASCAVCCMDEPVSDGLHHASAGGWPELPGCVWSASV